MGKRRPPDILRKSHAHTDGSERARLRRELRDELGLADESAAGAATLLIDLDGVLYEGDRAVDGAAGCIDWLRAEGIAHLFVTNTTSRPRNAIADKLDGLGMRVGPDDILTPPVAAAVWLREQGCRRLAAFVPDATRDEFADFELIDAKAADACADAVVVGDYGEAWTFAELNGAFRLLMADRSTRLVALGMTRYWRAPGGLRLDTAPFVVALAHAAGVEPDVLGKPARAFFDAALGRLGVGAEAAWMVGDDIRADIQGAADAGLATILVKTGKFRDEDLGLGIEPTLVLDSVAELPDRWRPNSLHPDDDSG